MEQVMDWNEVWMQGVKCDISHALHCREGPVYL